MGEEGREKQAGSLKQNNLLIGRVTPVHCRRKRQKVLATKAELDFQISAIHRITESQNHRMVGVGRDLCGSSSPTLLLKQGHLQ